MRVPMTPLGRDTKAPGGKADCMPSRAYEPRDKGPRAR
jgi:hypothetical protein